jgi:hypothetical protein
MSLLQTLRKETAKLEGIKTVVDAKVAKDKARVAKKLSKIFPAQPKKKPPTKEQRSEAYKELLRRCVEKIASRTIVDDEGRDKYVRTRSAYAIVGKYRVTGDFIEFDHTVRDITSMLDEKARVNALKHLAKRLGVRA